ncbi:MBG domain-containing protein, partial [Belliella pelovolcani]
DAIYSNNINAGTATASYDYEGDDNYLPSSDSEDFEIGKASTTTVVTINGGPFTYTGSAIEPATVSVTGPDGLNLTPDAIYSNNINAGTATASYDYEGDDNYLPSSDSEDFEIGKAPLTITADSFEKFTGQENPTFSVTYSGFVNDEDEENLDGELEFETDADRSSCAGSYLITPSGLTSSNYDITFVNGTLTVKPVHIDAIESSAPIQVGTNGTLKATVTADGVGVAGVLVEFFINETSQGTALTGTDGKASKPTFATMNDAGLFNLKASVGDDCAVSDVILTVFDPSGGFVTGGGWINSPAGALKADPSKEGRANYGFNAKYKSGKNQNEVDGNLEFNFQVGNFNFKSISMDNMSLTVSGHLATFTGKGRVNNVDGFSIFVSILDEALSDSFTTDKIRIRVTDSSGNVVYDNNVTNTNLTAIPETEIGGGNIVIHTPPAKGKGKKVTISELIEVPWNTPIDEIMNILNELSAEWTASGEISEITWKIDDYNAIQPGYYEVVGEYYNQATFAMMDPVYVPVIVMDKALPESITISKESISPLAKLGEVIGTLGTIDPADDVHTYRLEGTDMLTILGDQLIWNGSGLVPNGMTFTLFSMDRMGNEISREITLSREVDSNSILIYPNPAKTETNILIQLSEESVVGIKVFDASGRVIHEEQSVHSETFVKYLDLQGYSSGLYHVVVQIGNRVLSGRLVRDL